MPKAFLSRHSDHSRCRIPASQSMETPPARGGRWCGLAGRVRIWRRQGELVAAFIALLGTEAVGALEDTFGNGCLHELVNSTVVWTIQALSVGKWGRFAVTEGSLCPHIWLYVPTHTALCAHTDSSMCPRRGVSVPAHMALCARTYSSLCPHIWLSVPTHTALCALQEGCVRDRVAFSVF